MMTLSARKLGIDIIGQRLDDHTMGRGEDAEFDEILGLEEAAAGASAVTTSSASPASGSSSR